MSDREIEEILTKHIRAVCTDRHAGLPVMEIVGIPDVAQAIAALRAQDREDGAREMRERAIARVQDRAYLLEHGEPQAAVLRAVRDVAALPLSPARKEDGDA